MFEKSDIPDEMFKLGVCLLDVFVQPSHCVQFLMPKLRDL